MNLEQFRTFWIKQAVGNTLSFLAVLFLQLFKYEEVQTGGYTR